MFDVPQNYFLVHSFLQRHRLMFSLMKLVICLVGNGGGGGGGGVGIFPCMTHWNMKLQCSK